MRPHSLRLTGRVVLGMFAFCLAVVVDPLAPPARAAGTGCADPASAAIAKFFDDAVPRQLARNHVPGAVVSVVSGGATVFAKGYGLADVDHGVAFDPARSLVRIASITKLFTWTAVMQQVEAGRLDLNADVNQYLKAFQVPTTFPQPITLQTLMDHTSGFEYQFIGTGARTPADVPALGEYLAANMPARIRPPGEIAAYSNYGAALAGYIVTQVSGEPYDAYVQRHLFEPLDMSHSTAAEPVPAALAGDLAHSYDSAASPPQLIPFIFDKGAPDGSISTTASDMANFMIAHLHDGQFGDARILAPATAKQMHQRSFAPDPRLDGYAHGFRERTINGHRLLTHDGSWEGFESIMMLVPDCDLGLFVSTNGTGGVEAVTALLDPFFNTFTPANGAVSGPGPGVGIASTEPRAGFYQPARHNESSVEKVLGLLGPLRLTVAKDGIVHFRGASWAPQGNGLYRQIDGTDRLVFLSGSGGRRYVATDSASYQLMSRTESLPFNLLVLGAFLLVALSASAIPVAALWRRIRRHPTGPSTAWRTARWLAAAAAAAGLAFLIGFAGVVFGDTSDYIYGVPFSFKLLLCVPIVALTSATAGMGLTIRSWRSAQAGVVVRIHQVVLLLGMAALAWFLWQWNLIGWQFT